MGFLKKLRESSEKAVEKGGDWQKGHREGRRSWNQGIWWHQRSRTKGSGKSEKEQARAVTLNISFCRLMLPPVSFSKGQSSSESGNFVTNRIQYPPILRPLLARATSELWVIFILLNFSYLTGNIFYNWCVYDNSRNLSFLTALVAATSLTLSLVAIPTISATSPLYELSAAGLGLVECSNGSSFTGSIAIDATENPDGTISGYIVVTYPRDHSNHREYWWGKD